MSMQDPISDMLTRIRNAQLVYKTTLSMPHSNVKEAIAKVLAEEGYVASYETTTEPGSTVKKILTIEMKYHMNKPVIESIKRISRPGLRTYKGCSELPEVIGGMGIAIISTSKGIMSSKVAHQAKLGGEVICEVY